MLFVDSREKATIQALMESVAGPTSVIKLESADFLLLDKDGHSLGIERKTISDLLGSLGHANANGNKRLPDQLERMAETYTHRMLITEGTQRFSALDHKLGTPKRLSGWNAAAVDLFLWSFQGEGTVLIPTADTEHTAYLLRVLHNRSLEGCVLPKCLRQITLENAA